MRLPSILSCLLIILITGIHCEKKPATPVDPEIRITLDTEGLKYIRLTLGKYFIYKDSATGRLDSVVVTRSFLENVHHVRNPNLFGDVTYHLEKYHLDLTLYNGAGASLWFSGSSHDALYYPSSQSNYRIDFSELNTGIAFVYPVPPTSNPPSRVIPTVAVEGKVYNDVYETVQFNAVPITNPYYKRIVFWWAKGIGLIRLERGTSTTTNTYTLVRNS